MRIAKITIENYRSCAETTFAPNEHLSVLIGPNGSGKTNVLSALRLLPALCSPRHTKSDEPITSPCKLRVVYEVDGKTVVQVAMLSIVTNEKNQDEITDSDEYWILPDVTGPRRKVHIPSAVLTEVYQERSSLRFPSNSRRHDYFYHYMSARGIDNQALPILEKVIGFVTSINYYSASQFTNPGSSPISFEVESEARRRIGISITGHKKLLFDIYQEHRNKSDIYTEFIGLVGPEGIGLIESMDFDEIATSSSNYSVMTGGKVVKREKTNLLVVPSFKISGNRLSPSQLSEGTFKTLALIFYLVTDKSSLLMIEEPEVCVHHGLLSSIVELIKTYSNDKQIFISTHSDSVLDRVTIDNVFKVRRTKEHGSQVSSIRKNMAARELNALKDYLSNEGSLGEYWKHGDLESI
jgi:ABC-type lipoprotein export system ATPase subunit